MRRAPVAGVPALATPCSQQACDGRRQWCPCKQRAAACLSCRTLLPLRGASKPKPRALMLPPTAGLLWRGPCTATGVHSSAAPPDEVGAEEGAGAASGGGRGPSSTSAKPSGSVLRAIREAIRAAGREDMGPMRELPMAAEAPRRAKGSICARDCRSKHMDSPTPPGTSNRGSDSRTTCCRQHSTGRVGMTAGRAAVARGLTCITCVGDGAIQGLYIGFIGHRSKP
jgi:hypothetical protein